METQQETEVVCCPKLDPELWDDKLFEWENKHFIKDKVFTFFYMPMNFGQVMRRVDKKVRGANATIQEGLCLSDHTSKWNMDVYVAVDKDIPETTNATLSGKYLAKVYEGPFQDTKKWCKEYEEHIKSKDLKIKKWYMWYTTCPKCAKKYGKNYVVIMSEVESA